MGGGSVKFLPAQKGVGGKTIKGVEIVLTPCT